MIELSQDEKAYRLELLEASHRLLIHELHHTDTSKYEEVLREKLEVNERLTARVIGVSEWAAV
jgi:hypothetical protein